MVVLAMSSIRGTNQLDEGQGSGGGTPTAEFPDYLGVVPEKYLKIIHINDFYDVRQSPRCVAKMQKMRDADTLTFFSGDFMGPSIVSEIMTGEQMYPVLAVMNITWSVVGNHEFDYGVPRFLEVDEMVQKGWTWKDSATGAETTYTTENVWTVANFFRKEDGRLIAGARKWAERTVDGMKVCGFGLVDTAWMEATTLPLKEYVYHDFLDTARRMSFRLRRKQGCDFIFVLSHMENKSDEALLADEGDRARHIPAADVDFVFGGHDHLFYIKRIGHNLLLKSGMDFEQFSNVKMWWGDMPEVTLAPGTDQKNYSYLYDEEKNGDQTEFLFSLRRDNPLHPGQRLNVLITRVNVGLADPLHQPLADYIKNEVDPKITQHLLPVIHISDKLDAREKVLHGGESAVMNLFADVGRAYFGSDVAMVNVRMLKGEKVYHANSFLRRLDFMRLFPYHKDKYAEVELTGKEIVEVLQAAVPLIKHHDRRFVGVSGITFAYSFFHMQASKMKQAQLDEASVRINGKPVDPERVYRVVIVSGMADPKWGLGAIGTKVIQTPKEQQIEPIHLFDFIGNLFSEDPSRKQEFDAFTQTDCPGVTLDAIAGIRSVSDDPQLQSLDQVQKAGSCLDFLPNANAAILRRLRLYTLGTKYVDPADTRAVLSVHPLAVGRMTLLDPPKAREKIV